MTSKLLPFVSGKSFAVSPSAPTCAVARGGDTVLYRHHGQLVPARLVAPAGGDCWLARDARHVDSLIYLEPESIVTRLPRQELLGEAA